MHQGSGATPCPSTSGSTCPGPPASLPAAHGEGVSDHDYGWSHLDRCGSCRVMVRTCGWRPEDACPAARRAFQHQAGHLTVRAQRAWASSERKNGERVVAEILRDTSERLYVKALRRLAAYGDDKLASERAAFSTFWLTFLIRDVAKLYGDAAATIKPDLDIDSVATDSGRERSITRRPYDTLGTTGAWSVVDHLRDALDWLGSLTEDDQRLVVALLCLRITLKKEPSNSDVHQALFGEDTQARAGMQAVRRHLYTRHGDVPPVTHLIRDNLLPRYLGVDHDVRAVMVHLVVETVRELPTTGVPGTDQFKRAIAQAVALFEVRTIEAHGERPVTPNPATQPVDPSQEEEAS